MTVYLPFSDGSSVSFDGENFTVHRRPITEEEFDEQPAGSSQCKAEEAWSKNWGKVARALEGAWRRQQDKKRRDSAKRVYDNIRVPRKDGAV